LGVVWRCLLVLWKKFFAFGDLSRKKKDGIEKQEENKENEKKK